MDIDRTEHGGYRREVASKLGLHGNGRMTNEKPIKRATGGSIPKFATGGALKKLGHAMRHDISNAARKTREGFKDFGRKEKEGFESIGRKIKTDVIDKSRRGFNEKIKNPSRAGFQEHVAHPTRKAAATAKNMAREIGHDINKEVIKPAGRYLKESARKDKPEKMAYGGPAGGPPQPPRPTYRTGDINPRNKHKVWTDHSIHGALTGPNGGWVSAKEYDRNARNYDRSAPPARPYAPMPSEMPPPGMKRGGKAPCKSVGGHIGSLKIGSGRRVKENVQTRHNFQNIGRQLAGKKEKSIYGAKERSQRKEAGLPRMAHGGVGKLRHGVTPKSGITSSKWQDKDKYM